MGAVLGVAVRRFGLGRVAGGGAFAGPGDPGDVGQVGRRSGERRRPTLQQELPVVDDPGSCGGHSRYVSPR